MDYDKNQIIQLLQNQTKVLSGWFESQPEERFEFAPGDAWTTGQHLLHLIKSAKPLAVGLGFPRVVLLFKFGRVKQPSRNYEETIKYYKDGLSKGGQATGKYIPRTVKFEEKNDLIKRFRSEMNGLIEAVGKWDDGKMDKAQLPHPLLGNLTVREMLYFTNYHVEHHHKILQERYA
ncbi:MAG: hypothetical protein ACI9FU_002458 [Granulosicoccus sp.]|jgi:hypothetical protein